MAAPPARERRRARHARHARMPPLHERTHNASTAISRPLTTLARRRVRYAALRSLCTPRAGRGVTAAAARDYEAAVPAARHLPRRRRWGDRDDQRARDPRARWLRRRCRRIYDERCCCRLLAAGDRCDWASSRRCHRRDGRACCWSRTGFTGECCTPSPPPPSATPASGGGWPAAVKSVCAVCPNRGREGANGRPRTGRATGDHPRPRTRTQARSSRPAPASVT